jgi:hypothetical protein
MNKQSVSEILEKVIEIAEENNDEQLVKWAHLELGGYSNKNAYFTENDEVPKYREVPGEFRDHFGSTIPVDPEHHFINILPLRDGAAELEQLAKTSEDLLSYKNPAHLKTLREQWGVQAWGFVFSPSSVVGVLNAIKQETFKRSRKYASRKELISFEKNRKEQQNWIPKHITLLWLFKNIPIGLWWKLCVLLLFVFSLGLYVSGFPEIKKILHHLPLYRAKVTLSEETAKHIENQLNTLIETHNTTVAKLQEQLFVEESLASNDELSSSQRELHKEVADRIKETIFEENMSKAHCMAVSEVETHDSDGYQEKIFPLYPSSRNYS